MQTIDELLEHIVKNNFNSPYENFSTKDKKILISLNKQIAEGSFLTEKQGNYLTRILMFYKNCFSESEMNLIQSSSWSKKFRILENTKNVKISEDRTKILIEFSYDREIKKKVLRLMSAIKGNYKIHSPSLIEFDLNEKNVLLAVDRLSQENFVFSRDLLKINDDIKLILTNKQEILDSHICFNHFFKEKISNDFTNADIIEDYKILDRRIRYQYKFDTVITSTELHLQIANRNATNVFINSKLYTIENVIESLEVLDRSPILIIFDNRDVDQCINVAQKIADYPSKGTKGIYFRFDNTSDQNKFFNSQIQENNLNPYLNEDTFIAVISNNVLPKFLIKNSWRPKSVIALTNSFRNNKAHVFCNDVDLKIYYNNNAPVIGDLHEIL